MQNVGSPSPSSDGSNYIVRGMDPLSLMDVPRDAYYSIMRATDPRSQGRFRQTTRERYYDQIPAADSRLASAALYRESEERARRSLGSIAEVRLELTATHPDFRVVYTGSSFIRGDTNNIRDFFCTLSRHNAFIRPGVHPIAPSDVFFENNAWEIDDVLWEMRMSYVTRFREFVGSGSDIYVAWGMDAYSRDIVGSTEFGENESINFRITFPLEDPLEEDAGVNLPKTRSAEIKFMYEGMHIPHSNWHNLLLNA